MTCGAWGMRRPESTSVPPRRTVRDSSGARRPGLAQPSVADAVRLADGDAAANAVQLHVVSGNFDGLGIEVSGDDLGFGKRFGGGDGKHARAAAEIEDGAEVFGARKSIDGEEAAERRRVMRRTEGFARVDEYSSGASWDAMAVVRAVHDEAAGDNRRQGCLRDCDPVEIRDIAGDQFRDGPGDDAGEFGVEVAAVEPAVEISFKPPAGNTVFENGQRIWRGLDEVLQGVSGLHGLIAIREVGSHFLYCHGLK
jgi:hypothetical protein